jgi:hypothetical protein
MRIGGLLLLLVLAALLAVGLWSTRERAAVEDVPSEALLGGRRLFDAQRIVLQRAPDVRPLHFSHESPADPFMLVEPVVDVASRSFLEALRAVLDTAQRFLDGPLDEIEPARLQQMGLAEPRARIEVRYPDRTFAIAIGLEGPLHQDLYVAMDGAVYRTGVAVYSAIQVNTDDVRERLLVQSPLEDVRRLTLRRRVEDKDGGKELEVVEIERVGMAQFRLHQPIRTTADPYAAAALLQFLGGMAADQFLGTLNPMPDWDVQIELEGSRGVETITVWLTPQGLIGRQEPRDIQFTIKSADYTRTFEVPVDELRAKILVPIDILDLGRIEIDPGQGGGERIQLARAGVDELRLFQPVAMATDPAAINELLQATQKLNVVEFVAGPAPLAEFGLDRGFLTVSLHPRLRETDATVLHFGRDDGEATFVKRAAEDYVAKVPKAVVDVFRQGFAAFASRLAAIPVPVDASEIRYQRVGQEALALRRGAGGRWLRSDNGADVSEQASELLDLLRSLRGKRSLDGRDPAVAAELQAAARVEIWVHAAGGREPSPLVLFDRGRDDSGRKQAWVLSPAESRVVVELSVADTGALLAPLAP